MSSVEFRTRLNEALRLSDAAYGSAVLSPLRLKGPSGGAGGGEGAAGQRGVPLFADAAEIGGGGADAAPIHMVPGAADARVDLAVGSSIATLGQLQSSITHLSGRLGRVENIIAGRVAASPLTGGVGLGSAAAYAKGDWFEAAMPRHHTTTGGAVTSTLRSADEVLFIKNMVHDALDPIRDTLRHHERLLMDVVSTVNAAVGWGQVGRLTMVAGHAQRLGEVLDRQGGGGGGGGGSRRSSPHHRRNDSPAAAPTGRGAGQQQRWYESGGGVPAANTDGDHDRLASAEEVEEDSFMAKKVDRLKRLASDIRADIILNPPAQGLVSPPTSSSRTTTTTTSGTRSSTATTTSSSSGGRGTSLTTPSVSNTQDDDAGDDDHRRYNTNTRGASSGTSRSGASGTTTTTYNNSTPSEADKALAFRKLVDVNTSSSGAEDGVGGSPYPQQGTGGGAGDQLNTSALEVVRNIVSANTGTAAGTNGGGGASADNSSSLGRGGGGDRFGGGAADGTHLVAPSAVSGVSRQYSEGGGGGVGGAGGSNSNSYYTNISRDVSVIEAANNTTTMNLQPGGGNGAAANGGRSVHFAADQTTFMISNNTTGTAATGSAAAGNVTRATTASHVPLTTNTANNTTYMTSLLTVDPSGPNYTALHTTAGAGGGHPLSSSSQRPLLLNDSATHDATAVSLIGGLTDALRRTGSASSLNNNGDGARRGSGGGAAAAVDDSGAEHSAAYRSLVTQMRQSSM